jgi:hypothetical protein
MSDLNEQWARLLAAGKVRWMPGMLPEQDDRVVDVHEGGKGKYITLAYIDRGYEYGCNCSLEHSDLAGDTPDWTDPATIGCLLAMAREATGFASLYCRESRRGGWVACGREQAGGSAMTWRGPTEVAAILAAIEVAP